MPGHMGNITVTTQNLLVVHVDAENNSLLVKGAVPGHKNGYVIVKMAKKKKAKPAQDASAQPGKKKK